ncbi:ER degradation-enhancing alpha-mannosidase-like protein 3 isoform X1 [Planococcus citri]|uniref:ER degradation-enhancing alpha-mannosidase-like protein 3 isoform X1 n=1 Tax=Planococcus citri TaxID=170843 RepID=UPI0031F9D6B2
MNKILCIFVIYLLSPLKVGSSFLNENATETYMSREERASLKNEAVEMFYHAYNAYMKNAYPADELMPLSCEGRYRNSQPSRGNVDEALGNFSLTLIDTLDTLVVLGDFKEFENAVKLVIKDVNFNTDVVVSVFETNIRVLGGLLSAHVLSDVLKNKYSEMTWYKGELLALAKDLGTRLLPAFNTLTGIPYGRVNLKHGVRDDLSQIAGHTCTACAGTMILEMAALSRLTGDPIFEQKAHKAMDELWSLRHRTSNLMGTILDVHSGDWVRKESGVGAGIDSYYEYCLKAYILLSDEKYLRRFNTHYSAVMTYVSQGPMLLDVHMHKPNTNSKNFMDALLAFWPGLQVLKGDLKPAIETHEMLYHVMQKYKFIPEAFTTDFQIHWGHHPLRPEFLESTYFLYRATGDHYYLNVGKNVLRSLQMYARVPCGYASFEDVRTGTHEDSMDSFVLAETFKYLFLLFAEPSETVINLDDYLFTTEAHLLPLSISRYSSPNYSSEVDKLLLLNNNNESRDGDSVENDDDNDMARSCVIPEYVVGHFLRQNLRNMFEGICPLRKSVRKLHPSQFQSSNEEHIRLLKDMGIAVITLSDGRIQLVHNYLTQATSKNEAKEGAIFMQEMVELSKTQSVENTPQAVSYSVNNETVVLSAGPAHFGKLLRVDQKLTGLISVASPLKACEPLKNSEVLRNRIVVVERGDCMFVDKARKLEKAGAIGGIIVDNTPDSTADLLPLFTMSGDGNDDVNIPVVFLFTREAKMLIEVVTKDPLLHITLSQLPPDKSATILDAPNIYQFTGTVKGTVHKPLYEQVFSKVRVFLNSVFYG